MRQGSTTVQTVGGGVAERMIQANGVELCAEAFGDPRNPPVLLIMGTSASMLWWEGASAGCSPTVGVS